MLPSQKVMLTVTQNKKQLIGLIVDELVDDLVERKDELSTCKFKLVVTGSEHVMVALLSSNQT